MIVFRKNITKEQGETALFDDIRYFFYISNDDKSVTPEQIDFNCNKRCDQAPIRTVEGFDRTTEERSSLAVCSRWTTC
ncbi:MAG TPA: hypothetical protein PLR25_26035 [Planctomycetaceae bacterium]|nr:hypothetical protein [Planctomycetaceae bacterium]